jgi:hypothetical protein
MNVDGLTVLCLSLVGYVVCAAVFYILNMKVNFTNAKLNNVYNFDYVQPVTGERQRLFAKVVRNERWTLEDIMKLNFRSNYRECDSTFERAGNLITCVMPNGEYRKFWSNRVVNCRKIFGGGYLYRFASLI